MMILIEPLLTLGQSKLFFPASMFRRACDLLVAAARQRVVQHEAGAQAGHQLTAVEMEIVGQLQRDEARFAHHEPDDPWRLFFVAFAGSIGLGLAVNLDGPGNLLKMFSRAATEVEAFRFFAVTNVCLANKQIADLIGAWWRPDAAARDPLQQEFIHALNRYADLLTPLPGTGTLPALQPYDLDAARPPAFRFLVRRLQDRDSIQAAEWWIKPDADSIVIPRRSWPCGIRARLRRSNTGYAFPRQWRTAWTIRGVLWAGAGLLTTLALIAAAWSLGARPHP